MPAETAPSPRTWGPNDIPVPYVAAWTGESVMHMGLSVQPDGKGLCFANEEPADRDHQGVLWARLTDAPGTGTPRFPVMHSARQRRAMREMLCQVCAGPASRTSRGWLFLLTHEPADGAVTNKPPLCEPCVGVALGHCPRLTDPFAVRVRRPRVWGVFGDQWARGSGGILAPLPTDGYMPYGHPSARWFLATHLVLELDRMTRVPLPAGERSTP
ncbi:hypothetical protein [Streptomyces sp. NPDC053560]|uniref:hypothetical protein n=1 Tax=Streptomyces sp. NPDC053560 TaxID=3365711 RepID=UPI0037CFFBDC